MHLGPSGVGFGAAESRSIALLWVDDDLTTLETGGRLLALNGFRVDCAATGREGISLSRAREYQGIILDLVLPDCSGIDVLRVLRECGVITPVSILTGHASDEDAFAAGKLGVLEWRHKPAIGDDLIELARRLSSVTAGLGLLNDLPSIVGRLRDLQTRAPERAGRAMLGVLRLALIEPTLSTVEFLALCRAVRVTRSGGSALDVLDAAVRLSEGLNGEVRSTLQQVEAIVQKGCRSRVRDFSRSSGLTEREFSRRIRAASGATLGHLRIANTVRPSLGLLLNTAEQSAQIAYRLGYAHPTQFTRDFRLILGMTPTEFRLRFS